MNDITREDEVRYLQEKIAKNLIFTSSLSFVEIVDAIKNRTIELEPLDEDGTKIIDSDHIEEIKNTMQALINISNKPRSFIKSLEEKVPVELAKKINHKAIMTLSKDSNDWHSRTLLSVHPKNIVSDVNEETINLYENRFIISLIDKVGRLVNQAKVYYEQQKNAYSEKKANTAINEEYFYTTKSFPLYNSIAKNTDYSSSDSDYIKKINEMMDIIEEIEKKLRIVRSTEFYTVLRRCRRVTDPIQKTNILMYDHDYNKAYKLWKTLAQFLTKESMDLTPEIDVDPELAYKIYVMLMIFASLEDMGFNEVTNAKISIVDFNIKPVILSFSKTGIKLNLKIDEAFIFEMEYSEGKFKKIDEFHIACDYYNFENKNLLEVRKATDELIRSCRIDNKQNKNITGKYMFVSMNMTRCAKANSMHDLLYRRFYNIGDNYSGDEDIEFIKNNAKYKNGIQIIIPTSLRNNFLHIERLINYHILSHVEYSTLANKCPLCGSSKIKKINDNDYVCRDCSHMISIATHPNCKIDNKYKFLWVRYMDDNFLKRKEITDGDNSETYTKINLYQNIMGEFGINSFIIEKKGNGHKLKTICPCCGLKLGEK